MHKKIVTLVDDLDGTPASETIHFEVDGTSYEIDLSQQNARRFRAELRAWITRARGEGPDARSTPATRVQLPATGESRNALVRAWAAEQGQHVPARGAIPKSVLAAYKAAQSQPSPGAGDRDHHPSGSR